MQKNALAKMQAHCSWVKEIDFDAPDFNIGIRLHILFGKSRAKSIILGIKLAKISSLSVLSKTLYIKNWSINAKLLLYFKIIKNTFEKI